MDCCQVETSSLDFFLLPRLAGDRDLCPRLLCPHVTALLSLDGCCDGYGPDVEWVPSTREKLSALVQDLVQTQLFLCTPSWNHLAHFFFFFPPSGSPFESLKLTQKTKNENSSVQNFHNRFKSSQSAQTHPFSLHHKYQQGELKATTTWDQFPTGKNPSLSKPFRIKPSHFWQWSTAHYVHWIGTERSSCVESSLVIIVKISHFAWKKMRPNNWFFFFSSFQHFPCHCQGARAQQHT